MSSQQLVDDFNQLKKLLRAYPDIFILKTTGHPPDNYEIEYSIRGYIKDLDDKIDIGDRHRVRISLPFGYPHFAPIVKPLSHIFHPDIDPAAVRIAEWWAQNPSLPELVLHIGEMVRGRVYNLEDPFNTEAADWYKSHQNQLPLDDLRTLEVDDAEEPPADTETSGLTLDLEQSEDLEKPHRQLDESDVQYIHELIEDHKIFAANALLVDMPGSVPFSDRESLQKDIGKILRKTDQLFSLVEQLENLRKYDEALENLESIAAIASDAPHLEEIRARLKEGLEVGKGSSSKAQKARKAQWERTKRTKTEHHKQTDIRTIVLPLVVLLFLGLCGGVGWFVYQDQQVLDKVRSLTKDGQAQIKKSEFGEAKGSFEQAQAALKDLVVLQFFDKQTPIEAEIDKALQSRELQEGLKGHVLYDGNYVPEQIATKYQRFSELKNKAIALAEKDQLEQALAAYKIAARYAAKEGFTEEKASLEEHFYPLTLRYILKKAEQAEQDGNLEEAAALYQKIREFSATGPQVAGLPTDLDQKLSEITFRQEIDASRQAFIKSQWKQTILSLKRAQQYALDHPATGTEKDRLDLQRLLDNAYLNMYLVTAKEAFLTRKWPLAIESYNFALVLLSADSSTLRQIDDEIISKIQRIILQAQIMEQREQAMRAESQRNFVNTVKYNQEIQRLIRNSAFSNAQELQPILNDAIKRGNSASKELIKKEQLAWLEKNYEKIFRANYATLPDSQLLKPKAVFWRNVGNNPVYSLVCFERYLGRSSKIELRYMYNTAAGRWQLYSDR